MSGIIGREEVAGVTAKSLTESEPLQPQDLVITLLGTYVRPAGDTVWSGGLVTLLEELGFTHGAARVALTRLVRGGLIARVRSGRLVHYRLTERCERLLAEGERRIFSLGDARDEEGTWTVLLHQIPESRRLERSRLARRLRFLGFGPVQDSVWVSPHDHAGEVAELLEELGVGPFGTVFLARSPASSSSAGLAALASRAWNLSGLVERYDAFVAEFTPWMRRRRVTDPEAFIVRTRLMHLFRGFPTLDPELPEEPAPLNRSRARAVDVFRSVYDGLAEPSQRHFEAAATAYAVVSSESQA
jgi:phenylacetic acid degradation operon negative regulatory protein